MNEQPRRKIQLYFSDHFGVTREQIERYGAFDISLVADLPLFVDPFLLFSSTKPEYKRLHDNIIDYLRFLKAKASTGRLSPALRRSLYSFKEVKQNWLGFTQQGNRGAGLGKKFSGALHENLHTIFGNFGREKITHGSHLEKLCLVDVGVGRDRISDFTTRLILDFICEYTQAFAREHISPKLRRAVAVPRVSFNYELQTWVPKRFELPIYLNDFVLLTPAELLTKDDTWISRQDLYRDFDDIPPSIPNDVLRAQINEYFARQLPKEPSNKEVAQAIHATIHEYPVLIDYYIRYKEDHEDDARDISRRKVEYSERLFLQLAASLANLLAGESDFYEIPGDTYSESLTRAKYLKHVIEDRDGYRLFYVNGQPVEREQDVHVMFDLVWCGTPSDVNREVNNGRGPADFSASRAAGDKTITEIKLAGNPQLKRNLEKQAEIYKQAGRAQNVVKIILFFTENQQTKVRTILRELKLTGAPNVVVIDARADNKPSASKT